MDKGAEVKPYFDQAVNFHDKLQRAIKKASYLGKGCLTIEQQGYIPCFMDTTYYPEMISSTIWACLFTEGYNSYTKILSKTL